MAVSGQTGKAPTFRPLWRRIKLVGDVSNLEQHLFHNIIFRYIDLAASSEAQPLNNGRPTKQPHPAPSPHRTPPRSALLLCDHLLAAPLAHQINKDTGIPVAGLVILLAREFKEGGGDILKVDTK